MSQEHDPRTAALVLHDIQYANPELQVLLARPVAINLAETAKKLIAAAGKAEISGTELAAVLNGASEALKPITEQATAVFERVDLNAISQIIQVVQQLTQVRVRSNPAVAKDFLIDLATLAGSAPTSVDPQFGICSVPLYEFAPGELETVANGSGEGAIEALKRHGVLQYFFPPADQLALGLVEGNTASSDEILQQVTLAPQLGHPLAENELVGGRVNLAHVIDELQRRKLIVEGELGLELTPDGRTIRSQVRFKPREGLINKILKRLAFKVDISISKIFGGK